ncbi:SDR family oxidoreductase [Roseobacter weihaiensis]|uniref:SDR family oxidoreductase n=1 Tax=Roseobacter weihaiensis TaxID=2763262 RepID=UPI001D09F0C8|nr:SDR family oxidoreductase [Roseobacter sp. H9]
MSATVQTGSHARIVVTGASGVVGGGLVRALLLSLPAGIDLCCLFRSQASFQTFCKTLDSKDALRVQPVFGDLTRADTLKNVLGQLAPTSLTIGVHCAADVSWEKSFGALKDLNVAGSRAFAEALVQHPGTTRMIYVSSAYTAPDNWDYRNGYEESKAAAHRMLRDFPTDLQLSVFSCSLVIGDSDGGAINRFHGIYPLVKTLATGNLPFVVGNPDRIVDLVPVDVVSRELSRHVLARLEGQNTGDMVVAAGHGGLPLGQVFVCIEDCVNAFCRRYGHAERSPMTFVPFRRWEFLRRSLKTWQPEELSIQEFRLFERVLSIYKPYIDSDRVLAPLNMQEDVPEMYDVLKKSVNYWLDIHTELTLKRLTPRRGLASEFS